MTKISEKQVAPILKKMEINQAEYYPLTQMDSIRTTIQRMKNKSNKRFRAQKENGFAVVKRIA